MAFDLLLRETKPSQVPCNRFDMMLVFVCHNSCGILFFVPKSKRHLGRDVPIRRSPGVAALLFVSGTLQQEIGP